MECTCFGTPSPRTSSKITFTLFVFGWALLCGGPVLSVYGFASCQSDNCKTYKLMGPVLAGVGLACLMMADFTAIRDKRKRELEGDTSDPDRRFLCGKSRQLVQFLTLGILLVACGVIVSIPGLVVPACKPASNTSTTPKVCEALVLQISTLTLIGLCFCLAACMSKYHADGDCEEDPEASRNQPVPETVGDEVPVFPSAPPSYMAAGHDTSMSEDPPSYNSVLWQMGDHEYNVPWRSGPTVEYIDECCPSEPPPRYEDIYPTQPDPEESSSASLYHSVSESSESSNYELAPGP